MSNTSLNIECIEFHRGEHAPYPFNRLTVVVVAMNIDIFKLFLLKHLIRKTL